jgi:3-ketosteroid 9alpha-monooxygenase subunit B
VTLDPKAAGVSEEEWQRATAACVALRVSRIVEETHDARSIVFEIPDDLRERFRYKAGQFLSFKVPFEGTVLTRSYSLSSSPDVDSEHKVTIKRVDDGRVSNLFNDEISVGTTLRVVPPAGLFVLNDRDAELVLFSGGSGITPCISIVKTALKTTSRSIHLVYANRDARSVIFRDELEQLARDHAGRLRITHSLDDVDGFLDLDRVKALAQVSLDADFYMCGPGPFMATVEAALEELGLHKDRIHIEIFSSPPDPGTEPSGEESADVEAPAGVPATITVSLDGTDHEVAYEEGESVLHAARRAGLDPPFSCEEGYCSCCMAKLAEGEVKMTANDCLTPELLAEGWVLTCQSRCVSPKIKVEYPD